ncbi:probable G-protein coupled receptor Mth-like 6 isoform X1 [Culex pipiens pallens]|nr:probable G-protein coupled receptor Mth-like 6 isoform X1 [Culex pipiens pallens]
MIAKLRNVILLLLMATIAAAEEFSLITNSSDALNDTTLVVEDYVPYPDILTGVCCILMMLIVLYLHIRIPTIRSIFKCSLPSFLVGMISLYSSLLILYSTDTLNSCSIIGYMIGFSIIVSVYWFSVMCYESHAAFSGRKLSVIRCCLYGWGILGAYLVICLALSNLIEDVRFKPPFAVWICSFGNDTAMLLYYVLPLSFLMLASFCMLVKTKLRINQFASQPEDTIRTDTKLDRERFFLTVLISVVLALSFALNVLSWAFPDNHVLYFLSSVSFYVVGVVIFFLFICNRHVDQWCGRSR